MRVVARSRIEQATFGLLDASPLCAISTVSPHDAAHINTAYFVWSHELEIFWLSDPTATHSRNIHVRPHTAIAVYESDQAWGKPDRGIQLFGSTIRLPATDTALAESLYAARFPGYATSELRGYGFYRLRASRLRVFDEPVFGLGVFVTASIDAQRHLIWERTDIAGGAEAT